MNSQTLAPVPRAHVVFKDTTDTAANLYGALTNPDGKFTIEGIKPGTYSVTASRTGFVTPRGDEGHVKITLKTDQKATDFRVTLTPCGAISGQVTDAAGNPAEGISVVAESLGKRYQAGTDEKGQYRIGGLAPGKFRVRTDQGFGMGGPSMRPEIRTDGTKDLHNAAITWYPGVLTAKEAGKVEVLPDAETRGVDIRTVAVPWVRVSGRVIGMPAGATMAFATVASREMGGGQGNPIAPDGSFEISGLSPGKYSLIAGWGRGEGGTGAVEIEVAGSNINRIELRAVPEASIPGRLEPDTPDSARAKTQRMVTLSRVGYFSGILERAPVGEDDTFTLPSVTAGKYVVGLSWDSAYVRSMRLGNQSIDGPILDLSNGSGGTPLEVEITPATASLSGIVHDDSDKPCEARVLLLPDDESPSFVRTTTAKNDGTYTFSNLPPGAYKVAAFFDEDAAAIERGAFLNGYEDLFEHVEVHDADKASKDLKRQ